MRDRSMLHPILQYKIRKLIKKCNDNGLKIEIGECYRTVKEQNDLHAKGRTKPGNIVTNCKGDTYSSMHQWGVAFDFYRIDGKGAYNTSGQFFEKVGAIGKAMGLEWGGDWKSIKDRPHFQLPYWGSTSSKLKKKYKTPSNFEHYWYPNRPVGSVKRGSPSQDVLWIQIHLAMALNIQVVPDGVFGPKTELAIQKYQKKVGVPITGVADLKTILNLSKLDRK